MIISIGRTHVAVWHAQYLQTHKSVLCIGAHNNFVHTALTCLSCFVFVSGEQLPCWQLARAWCQRGATSWTTPYHWCAPTMMNTLMCFLCWTCVHSNMWPTFSRLLSTGLRPWISRPLWTHHRWTERGEWKKWKVKMLTCIQGKKRFTFVTTEEENPTIMLLKLSFFDAMAYRLKSVSLDNWIISILLIWNDNQWNKPFFCYVVLDKSRKYGC